MYNRAMMNWLSLIVSAFALFFIVLFFAMNKTGTVRAVYTDVSSVQQEIESANDVIKFLNSPWHDAKARDLLIESYYGSNFDELRALAKTFFSPSYETAKKSWKLKVIEQPNDDEISANVQADNFNCDTFFSGCKKVTPLTILRLPVQNDNVDYLELEFLAAELS